MQFVMEISRTIGSVSVFIWKSRLNVFLRESKMKDPVLTRTVCRILRWRIFWIVRAAVG